MDIKVTIKKKNRRKESSNIPWTTGIAAVMSFFASYGFSRIYLDGCHHQGLIILSMLFGFLSAVFIFAFFFILAGRTDD